MRPILSLLCLVLCLRPDAAFSDDWSRLAKAAAAVRRLDDVAAQKSLGSLASSEDPNVQAAANHLLARLLARAGEAGPARAAFEASASIDGVWSPARRYAEIDVLEAEGRHVDALKRLVALRKEHDDFRPMEVTLRASRLSESVLPPAQIASQALAAAAVSQVRLPGDELLDRAARAMAKVDVDEARKLDRRLMLAYPESDLADQALARLGGLQAQTRAERLDRVGRLFERRAYERCRDEARALWDEGARHEEIGYYLGKIGSERLRDDVPGAIVYLGPASAPTAEFAQQALSSLALAMGKAGRGPAALRTWDLWLARYGDGPELDDAGRAAAKKRFREEVVRKPAGIKELVEAHYDRARLLHQLGRSGEAARALEVFLESHKAGFDVGKYRWFIGFWRYRAGEYTRAITAMRRLSGSGNSLVGGKAQYWIGRSQEALGKRDEAITTYVQLIADMPLTYYSALAERRLEALGEADRIPTPYDPSGVREPTVRFKDIPDTAETRRLRIAIHLAEPDTARAVLGLVKPALLQSLGKGRLSDLEGSLAEQLETYATRRSEARSRHAKAMRSAPSADTIAGWRAVYPRAFSTHVAAAAKAADYPEWLVYSHMLQESRFKPWMISGAPAFGLLELLDRTARRLAAERGDDYQRWKLMEPRWNVRWGTQYLGALAAKFDGRLPLASASYNGGPRLVVALLDRAGQVPFDVFVDDMPTHETRNYTRRVIEHAIRYAAIWTSPKEARALRARLFRDDWRGAVLHEPDY